MTTPDREAASAAPAAPLRRAFLVAEGPGMEAELARQGGPHGLRSDDFVIVMTSPHEWTLPNGEVRRAGDAVTL